MNYFIQAVFFILASAFSVFSQEVISSQGTSYTNSTGNIDYTLGETVISSLSDGLNDITQGFHQTNWTFLGVEDFHKEIQLFLYPNPTSEILTVEASSYKELFYEMFNAEGKIVLEGKLVDQKTEINVSALSPGNYTLSILNKSQVWKAFKLLKSN